MLTSENHWPAGLVLDKRLHKSASGRNHVVIAVAQFHRDSNMTAVTGSSSLRGQLQGSCFPKVGAGETEQVQWYYAVNMSCQRQHE